ncbi:MAG: hypothetical protein AAGF12_23350 [Myxococcota bacterium]
MTKSVVCSLVVATGIALIPAATPATAQSCGSDSSPSDSSSHDDDDDYDHYDDYDSSSSGDVPAPRKVCRDATHLTGFENCSRFGAGWNSPWPALRLEVGFVLRRVSLAGTSLEGTAEHEGRNHRYNIVTDEDDGPSLLTGGLNLRLTSMIGRHFLVGAELDLAGGPAPDAETERTDHQVDSHRVVTAGGGFVVGLVLPLGPLRLRGEVMTGGQALVVSGTSQIGDCIVEESTATGRFLFEPRVALEWFVAPWVSFDVWAGADLIQRGTLGGGIRLNFHARSYDAVP